MILFGATASAEAVPQASSVNADPIQADHQIKTLHKAYFGAFVVAEIETVTLMGDEAYDINITYKTKGLANLFSKASGETIALGQMSDAGRLIPTTYEIKGNYGGDDFRSYMEFDVGTGIVTEHQQKTIDDDDYDYIPVPDDMKKGPDPISFFFNMIANQKGELKPPAKGEKAEILTEEVFGGLMLQEYQYRCDEWRKLKESSRNVYSGPVVRCEFGFKNLAGEFRHKDPKKQKEREEKRKKAKDKDRDPIRAWFAPMEETHLMVPVYSEFDIGIGKLRIHLAEMTTGEK